LRGAAANLGLALGSTLLALLAIEAYLRWVGAFEMPAGAGCYEFTENPRLIYEPKPHCGGTNAAGMHDREFDLARTRDPIVVIGDSVSVGPGVPSAWAWPERLERLINRRRGGRDVLNFAVEGYATVQEVETLRTKALRFRPRTVLLQYLMNDEEIYSSIFVTMMEELRRRKTEGYVDAHQALDPRSGWLARRVLLSRTAIALRLGLAHVARSFGDGAATPDAVKAYYTEHSPVREGLEELGRLASAYRFDVLVLIFPHAWGTGADRGGAVLPELSEYPHAWVFDNARMLGLCRELGFTCIDLAGVVYENPRLRALSSRRMFNDGCCHLGVLGHKVMAWVVYRELVARHLMR